MLLERQRRKSARRAIRRELGDRILVTLGAAFSWPWRALSARACLMGATHKIEK